METVRIDDRLTKIQNKLFEQAHTKPLELKYLAIAINKQGINGEKLYSHPGIITLPMQFCGYLRSLSKRQKAILSAAFLANFYKFVANSESQTLVSNISVGEKVFASYSDEYMILHQETNEELDHIWSFRTIHSMVVRETGVKDSFDEPGFFYGNVGAISQLDMEKLTTHFTLDVELEKTLFHLANGKSFLKNLVDQLQVQDRNWLYRTLRFIVGDAVRMLPAQKVQENGLGGLWLLFRYVANVELKQAESFLFDDPENFDYEPLAFELNQGHLADEARHYTTSFDLGLELYKKASPEAQDFIRHFMQRIVEDNINGAFRTYLEKIDLIKQGLLFTDVRVGLDALRMSLNHPEFANKQIDFDELVDSWRDMSLSWRKIIGPLEQKTWHYRAQQLSRLIQSLELELNKDRLGNRYKRYQDALETKDIQKLVEVAQ
ncbi:hypothetical protein GNF10_01175 [Nostoc sp. UCD121]|uniref:hypothetical protein n=1 Tax=unclassified Nostoc TaxID=2593658 RepID=UPI001625C4C9|nr:MULTISPECIES: hypothetical protein [unclassified Nostoc]MBC1219228.1 hypothetical protein [Nostoc sp. UCD120]MBC1274627.1 hypothetical protein [Nostoc sp. UCD121]MBC1295492.1 hypothetical protein [Nostoc sp. UCD122]